MAGFARYNFKIFIVDDDEMLGSMYYQHLQNNGYTDIRFFQNGKDCLDALVSKPEVIFLDQEMDDMRGIEVLKAIKRFDPGIYVVIISGLEDKGIAVASLELGAFDYITKGEGDLQRLSEILRKIQAVKETLGRNSRGFFLSTFLLFM